MALADIYQKATLVQIPSGYKAADAELYSVVPNTTAGDFTVSLAAGATRVNKDGLIESVAANQARLDYNLTNPQDPTLLLEPTRTNSLTYSEDFTNSNWFIQNSASLTPNNVVAPDGTLTASTLQNADGTSISGNVLQKNITLSSDCVTSIYIKSLGSTTVALCSRSANGTQTFTSYNISGNEWKRFDRFIDTSSSALNQFSIGGTNGDIAVWGAQVEAGSYATSYITTSDIAVTRTADTCSLPNFSNTPTDYPLTVYWKGEVKEFNGFNCAFSIYKDGEAGVFLVVSFNTSSEVLVRRADGSGEDVDFISYSYSLGDILKIGIKFTSATTFKLFINGSEIYNETSGVSKTWNFNSVLIGQLRIVADTGTRNPCNELMLFNEALTDAELQTLTS